MCIILNISLFVEPITHASLVSEPTLPVAFGYGWLVHQEILCFLHKFMILIYIVLTHAF